MKLIAERADRCGEPWDRGQVPEALPKPRGWDAYSASNATGAFFTALSQWIQKLESELTPEGLNQDWTASKTTIPWPERTWI